MPADFSNTLVVAVSSRALFNLDSEARIFEEGGLGAFIAHQRANEAVPLVPGPAFPLVRALLALNAHATGPSPLVEVVIVSGQHPDTGLRILNSVASHGLSITRAGFTGGAPTAPYIKAFKADLLLSRSAKDVQEAVDAGVAAAQMYDFQGGAPDAAEIRIAFDGDAVLFSEESEALYKREGLAAFQENEREKAHVPLPDGPFGKLLRALHRMQEGVPGAIRTALVTARNAPAHERALRTLRSWGVSVDEAFFLGGLGKSEFLAALRPQIFFDDQDYHLAPASRVVPSAKVPYPSGSALNPRPVPA